LLSSHIPVGCAPSWGGHHSVAVETEEWD